MTVVREYDPTRDLVGVEDVERRCEVGPSGKLSLFTDLLGDPICRIRHSPSYLMLVITCFTIFYLLLLVCLFKNSVCFLNLEVENREHQLLNLWLIQKTHFP